jgi:hypothetical protein
VIGRAQPRAASPSQQRTSRLHPASDLPPAYPSAGDRASSARPWPACGPTRAGSRPSAMPPAAPVVGAALTKTASVERASTCRSAAGPLVTGSAASAGRNGNPSVRPIAPRRQHQVPFKIHPCCAAIETIFQLSPGGGQLLRCSANQARQGTRGIRPHSSRHPSGEMRKPSRLYRQPHRACHPDRVPGLGDSRVQQYRGAA